MSDTPKTDAITYTLVCDYWQEHVKVCDPENVKEIERELASLLGWAVERWNAEVKDRPLENINRRPLDDTWRQVIRKLGGNPDKLLN